MSHRLTGRLADVQGVLQWYLSDGDATVNATPGVQLSSGWTVKTVTPDGVTLAHPAQPGDLNLAWTAGAPPTRP